MVRIFLFSLVIFAVLGSSSSAQAADNLLQNGSLDLGGSDAPTIQPWVGPGRLVVKVKESNRTNIALGLRGTCGRVSCGVGRGHAYQRIKKPGSPKASDPGYANRCFHLSFRKYDVQPQGFGLVRIETEPRGGVKLSLNVGATQSQGGNGAVSVDDRFKVTAPEGSVWSYYKVDFKMPENRKKFTVDLRMAAPVAGLATFFDDITVSPIDCHDNVVRVGGGSLGDPTFEF